MDASSQDSHRCSRCGAPIDEDTPEALCPACLLARAMEPVSEVTGHPATDDAAQTDSRDRGVAPRLKHGQTFGPYLIERLLGRGGMGEVYEATRLDQKRRVAIKVLGQRLTDAADRARFLREGQLAASISHPNSVYIFGSDEIDGIPVIEMELSSGGTLRDRVSADGPLPYPHAVDAILQVIAGLDAAQAAGVLHRDVKPSNCFMDEEGRVRVGDFGLSISTLARDAAGADGAAPFQGTPQFASPEQLRGEPLDFRSDIYAVGATLYYLLTGRPPVDAQDLKAIRDRAATAAPASPRTITPGVPRGLARVVLRCLASDRNRRPASYAALDDALRPFSSEAPAPATVGLRLIAGIVDYFVLSVPLGVLVMSLAGTSLMAGVPPRWSQLVGVLVPLVYFGTLEGLWGTTVGKRLCGLQVIRRHGPSPGLARAFGRAAIFEGFTKGVPMVALGVLGVNWFTGSVPRIIAFIVLGMLAYSWLLLFVTLARGNGFSAIHDLVTGTRVVQRRTRKARALVPATEAVAETAGTEPHRLGPYDVIATVGGTDRGELLQGTDPRLGRAVWIHRVPAGTPSLAPEVRDVDRPGTLRWLDGHRGDGDNWDVYEAPGGASLRSRVGRPESWATVRHWLLDVAVELKARLDERSPQQYYPDVQPHIDVHDAEPKRRLHVVKLPSAAEGPGQPVPVHQ